MDNFDAKWRWVAKLVLLLLSVATTFRVADINGEQLPQQFDKNAVQFIFASVGTNYVPAGTCFAMVVPPYFKRSLPKRVLGNIIPASVVGIQIPYLVTAKHVLFDEAGNLRTNLYWRANKADTGVSYTPLTPNLANQFGILTNVDKSVDIAVLGATTNDAAFNATALKQNKSPHNPRVGSISSALVKDRHFFERNPIREGDEMFFVGLFTPFYGQGANIPICRFGKTSIVTDEKIPFLDTSGSITPQDLYVVETQVFGGNSGSPAFF